MRILLPVFLVVLLASSLAHAQKPASKPPAENFVLKKQIFVDDIESQLSSVQYAYVRVNIRCELAKWLWKTGKDDTNRAEALAVKAIEELYEKRDEIEDPENLKAELFTLLEEHSKDKAAKLKAKYFQTPEDDLNNVLDWVDKPGGEKIAAAKLLKYLNGRGSYIDGIYYIIDQLRDRGAPEYPSLLAALLAADESGRIPIDDFSFQHLYSEFADAATPPDIRYRYFQNLLARTRACIVDTDPRVALGYANLLRNAIRDLGQEMPELIDEAKSLAAMLMAKHAKPRNSISEAEQRINESADKLGTIIDEAEKTDDVTQKTGLYLRGIKLAIDTGKFAKALDAVEAFREVIRERQLTDRWTDDMLLMLVPRALQKNEVALAQSATGMIVDVFKRAETLQNTATFFYEKRNMVDAVDAIDRSIKILEAAPSDTPERVYGLLRIIYTVSKVNKPRLQETIVLTAKSIDDLPTPSADDKPGTPNFKAYIRAITATHMHLDQMLTQLLRMDKAAAIEFAGRIQKREIRVLADMIIGIDTLESSRNKLPPSKN